MSFFNQRTIYYLIDQFNYLLLILCIKTPAMLKCQRFDNGDSKKRVPKVYNHPQIKKIDNEKQDWDKYQGEADGYVLFPLALLPPTP